MTGFACLLAASILGETAARLIGIPIPGTVLGLLIVLAGLFCLGRLPEDVGRAADQLLTLLPFLLVVPAAGLFQQQAVTSTDALLLVGVLVASTVAAMAASGLVAEPNPARSSTRLCRRLVVRYLARSTARRLAGRRSGVRPQSRNLTG